MKERWSESGGGGRAEEKKREGEGKGEEDQKAGFDACQVVDVAGAFD